MKIVPKKNISMPAPLRHNKSLEPMARILYAELNSQADEKGVFTTTYEAIAKLFHVTEQTAKIWVKSLKEAGLLTLTFKGDMITFNISRTGHFLL